MKITLHERHNDPYKRNLYHRLARVCYKMHDRCNNPNQKCYKNYGGRGVYYCDKWATVKGFLEDVDKIPGWDERLFMEHKLQLDKDFRNPGNKEYSVDNCMWIDKFTAYNVETKVYEHGTMKTAFARKHGLSYSTFLGVLNHTKHRVGSWIAWYDDDPNIPDVENDIFIRYGNYGKHKLKL